MTRRLLTTQKIVNLTSDPASGTAGEVYYNSSSNELRFYNGTFWSDISSGAGGSSVTVSDTEPVAPSIGDQWYESSTGILYIYYDSYWVQVAPGGNGGGTGGGGITEPVGGLDFNTGSPDTDSVGRLAWNDGEGTLNLGLKGGQVVLQLGQEQVVRVYNSTGATLDDGKVVYIIGAQGQRPAVALARADNESTSAYVLGVTTETILADQEGYVTTFGLVNNLDTSTFTEGSAIWLSATTAGTFTETKPVAPNHLVLIGFVVRSHASSGQIFVKNQNGYELEELHDVLITGEQNNDALIYDSVAGVWKNNGTYLLNTSSTSQTKTGNLTISGTATTNILDLNESQLTADVKNINVTTAFLIDSFSSSVYRSAEYILQFSQGSNYGMTKLMLIHDGADVAISEYGHVEIGTEIPYIFNASYSLGNLEITITCSTANITPVDLKFTRTLFDS